MPNLPLTPRKHIDYLDLLRVVAIIGVISFHFLYSSIARGRTPDLLFSPLAQWAKYGYLGVELFFMISGFVIVQSVRDLSLREFIAKRFVRLYPMYWLALLMIFGISTLGIWGRQGPYAKNLYYNLTMFPTAFGQTWFDAAHWFMARQLQFYLAIALILALRSGKYLGKIFIWWAIIGSIWNFLGFDNFSIWYLNGFFALIAGGAIINGIREYGFSKFRTLGLIASYLWAMKSRIDSVPWLNFNRGPGHSALIIGIVVTVIFILMALTWSSHISNLPISGVAFLGTLSFPIYLIHNRLGGLAIARFATESNKYFLYILVIIFAVALAYLLLKIEGKVMSPFTKSNKKVNIKP